MNRRDIEHYTGCLIGGAIGDALGAFVEFSSWSAIQQEYGDDGIQEFPSDGLITDDTQMTLFTAEGLIRSQVRSACRGIANNPTQFIYQAYLRWLETQGYHGKNTSYHKDGILLSVPELRHQRAPGNTCLSALSSGVMGTMEQPINNSKGCGGVMRAAPIGLVWDVERAFQLGCESAAITHGHPSGYLASGCFAAMIASIVAGDSLKKAIQTSTSILRTKQDHEECLQAIEAAQNLAEKGNPTPNKIEQLGGGWVAEEALSIAIYCSLICGDDFLGAIRLTVNHSGDSDSTGSIAGNILGLLYGKRIIPENWISQLELHGFIEQVAEDLLLKQVCYEMTDTPEGEAFWNRYPGC